MTNITIGNMRAVDFQLRVKSMSHYVTTGLHSLKLLATHFDMATCLMYMHLRPHGNFKTKEKICTHPNKADPLQHRPVLAYQLKKLFKHLRMD